MWLCANAQIRYMAIPVFDESLVYWSNNQSCWKSWLLVSAEDGSGFSECLSFKGGKAELLRTPLPSRLRALENAYSCNPLGRDYIIFNMRIGVNPSTAHIPSVDMVVTLRLLQQILMTDLPRL